LCVPVVLELTVRSASAYAFGAAITVPPTASAAAHVAPRSTRKRLRLFGLVGESFMCLLPPRDGWREASSAVRPGGLSAAG
jgi:hypothetical protein